MSDNDSIPTDNYLRLMLQIRELEEMNKMLQTNMFHYECRCRDALMKVLKLEMEVERLEKLQGVGK